MMFGRELRLPDTLRYSPSPDQNESTLVDYVVGMKQRRKHPYGILEDQQAQIKGEVKDEPLSSVKVLWCCWKIKEEKRQQFQATTTIHCAIQDIKIFTESHISDSLGQALVQG